MLSSTPALVDPEMLRRNIFEGGILRVAPTCETLQLVEYVERLLQQEFEGLGDLRRLQFVLPTPVLLERLGRVRRRLVDETEAWFHLGTFPQFLHLSREPLAVDALRLRAVLHEGHVVDAAAPAYSAHRDTWFANPHAQINFWVPLHDVGEDETFVFFPDAFGRAVPNDSARFDYARWREEVGWQRTNRPADAIYPTVAGTPDLGPPMRFSASRGEVIVFSAAQLHQPVRQVTGRTRFSVDFRFVVLRDVEAGHGARNVDAACTGSALDDYRRVGP